MILQYYKRFKHLRIAQSYVKDIEILLYLLDNYNHYEAINTVSHLTTKYEDGINKIGAYFNARTVVKGEINELYQDHTSSDMIDDIEYLINCIIIIAVVNLKIEPNIETVIKKLNYD